ncbi:MAG: Holliday junction branch migration protein RuvA [Rickettsiales bacterium]|nr:Holliday junction branch migration protein RuvA [Rickettsiales bacterium]
MIGKLYGIVDSIHKDHVTINVSGVGYLVSCSFKTVNKMVIGDKTQLFIETQMKDSGITLYGFANQSEKECFLKLITIKGLGPKLGLAILGVLTPEQVYMSLAAQDKVPFLAISGVGSKIVSRLFTELKASDLCFDSNFSSQDGDKNHDTFLQTDAVSALVNLGVNRTEAYNIVSKILLLNKTIDLNTLIRESLSKING